MKYLKPTTLLLTIIGGINWLSVGLFNLNIVNHLFGNCCVAIEKLVYILVGLSALYSITLFQSICQDICKANSDKTQSSKNTTNNKK